MKQSKIKPSFFSNHKQQATDSRQGVIFRSIDMKDMSDKPVKVLLVEDNPGDARLIREFLFEANRASFEIKVAQKLSDGLEALSASTFDVVLLDLSLPDSTGLETLIMTHANAPQVPIIVLTGLDNDMLAVEAVRRGAQDYLVKGQINAELLYRAMRYSIERKQAEEERQKLQAQLQRAQKMETMGTLAGGVAHDLNNVLSGIVAYPDLLLMQLPEDSPLRAPILAIRDSGIKAATIVRDLLDLARRGVVATEVVSLNGIISQYLKSPEHEKINLHHPGVEVETDLEADLLNISGSSVHLSKTVMNLVSNAVEAMTDGGKVFISTENRYVDRPISGYDRVKEGDYIILTVSDTGIGISAEDMGKIFEPFYTKKKMGRSGTGLGMAVVWGTVKDHNGYIDVRSTEGKGTTFTLFFPATRQEISKDKDQLSIEEYMGNGESILVVDDLKQQQEMAYTILTTLGYEADTVSSGEEALEYLKEHTVDLVILDMIMDPGIDGLDTYRKILEVHPGQKAIIASGFSETDRVKESQKLGAGAYVKKPYLLENIGMAVRAELEK